MMRTTTRLWTLLSACVLSLLVDQMLQAQVTLTGVNLAGADFGEGNLPGTYNVHYTYPTTQEVDYYVGKGVNTFRIPFRWERLQRTLNGSLNTTELGRLETIVNYATSQGAHVVLDPHNYARYNNSIIGSGAVPYAAFNDFWTRVANEFKDNDKVIFGLVNEPNTMPTEQWGTAAQGAINAIRGTGAENLILVPGNAWTGAHSWLQNWYGTPNAQVMDDIVDPANNFAFDLHQYLDGDSSGTSATVVSQTIGVERLTAVTNWMRDNNRKAFLGEFAVANSTIGAGIGDEAITNMLNYMNANDDVWIGWTWWAGGPWWSNYMYTIEPTNLGQPTQADRPVMGVVQPFFYQEPVTTPGDFDEDGDVDGADLLLWQRSESLDPSDLADWQENYGIASLESVAIPEPTALTLLIVANVRFTMLRHADRQSLVRDPQS